MVCKREAAMMEGAKLANISPQTNQAITTAMAISPTNNQIFLTADKNGEIAVWRIGAAPSMSMAKMLPPETTPESGPNAAVVTCLEIVGDVFILAGTYGQGVNVWDLRFV